MGLPLICFFHRAVDRKCAGLISLCLTIDGRVQTQLDAAYGGPRCSNFRRAGSKRVAPRHSIFFASATVLATGGVLVLICNADKLIDVADDLSLQPVAKVVWEIKLFLTLLLVTNAFLKFVWAHRLFGYFAILMAAEPTAPKNPQRLQMSRKAGEVNITAARSYNRGLRAIYFSIASVAWLISPMALMAATMITFGVLLRRKFLSRSRVLLLGEG